jgi:hypothetical protein
MVAVVSFRMNAIVVDNDLQCLSVLLNGVGAE